MPVTMSGYGQSYMPMGGPDVGAAIYGAQRQQVNFARMVELQKLNLQKQALRQQAAMQAAQLAQREQARQDDLAMQQTRFDLEERKIDMQDAETQQRRQDILAAYERAEQEKSQREAQALLDERNKLTSVGATEWDGQGERPKQYYTLRDGTVYDLSGVDMGKVRGSSSQQAGANPDAIRKELNTLSAQGARPLGDGEKPTQNETLYIGPNNQMFAVPKKTEENQTQEHDPRVNQTNPSAFATTELRNRYVAKYGRDVITASAESVVEAEGLIDEEAKNLGILLENGEMNLDNLDNLKKLAEYEKKEMKAHNLTSLNYNYGTLYEVASTLAEHEGLSIYKDEKKVKEMIDEAHEDYNQELRGVETQSDRILATRNRDETIKRIRDGAKRYAELSQKIKQYSQELIDRIRKFMPKTFGK